MRFPPLPQMMGPSPTKVPFLTSTPRSTSPFLRTTHHYLPLPWFPKFYALFFVFQQAAGVAAETAHETPPFLIQTEMCEPQSFLNTVQECETAYTLLAQSHSSFLTVDHCDLSGNAVVDSGHTASTTSAPASASSGSSHTASTTSAPASASSGSSQHRKLTNGFSISEQQEHDVGTTHLRGLSSSSEAATGHHVLTLPQRAACYWNIKKQLFVAKLCGQGHNEASNPTGFSYVCKVEHHDPDAVHTPDVFYYMFFMFYVILLSLFCRVMTSKSAILSMIPHTAWLFIFAMITALVVKNLDEDHAIRTALVSRPSTVDPHLVFWVLLPPLLYEDSAGVDFHVMKRVMSSSVVLAGRVMMSSSVVLVRKRVTKGLVVLAGSEEASIMSSSVVLVGRRFCVTSLSTELVYELVDCNQG